MKTRPIILKLGGSVISDKRGARPVASIRRIKRLAGEVARATPASLILLYGGGSFGHPLVHRYKLSGRALSRETFLGAGRTMSAMRSLGTTLANIFLDAGVPVVPLQTSSFVREEKGSLVVTNYALIEDILAHGGVPFFGGDVVVADHRRTIVVSADRLASLLAKYFKSKRILFATDVDGVYKKFPPRRGERPLSVIRRRELTSYGLSKARGAPDVTGAMAGKLRALLSLKNCDVTIFNGLVPGVLTKVLRGETQGTRIVL